MKQFILQSIFCIFISSNFVKISGWGPPKKTVCTPTMKVCEFKFKVTQTMTMLVYPLGRIIATDGVLHIERESADNITHQVPLDRLIMADGFPRMVTVINNQLPGPPIIVYEGQTVIVHVENALGTQSTTIHWHGLHQKGTNWMDGPNLVTQCPISPGQSFTYKFKADPVGTHYYHSHVHGQRMDGVSGAFIVRPKPTEEPAVKEAIMQVSDWWHEVSDQAALRLFSMDYFTRPNWTPSVLPNGLWLHPTTYYSLLIEGRGRYTDKSTGKTIKTPLKIYDIEEGSDVRFRVINTGDVLPLRVSVDNHTLRLVASDGSEFKPQEFESFISNPGERYDFIITGDQSVGNYWIRVRPVHKTELEAKAILRYKGAPIADPTTTEQSCTSDTPCSVLNCMFKDWPNEPNTKCVSVDELQGLDELEEFEGDTEDQFFNYAADFTPQTGYKMFINGNQHNTHDSDMFFKDKKLWSKTKACDRKDCLGKPGSVCLCFNIVDVKRKTVQLVLTSIGRGEDHPYNHPIHLHGYNFQVLKVGYSTVDNTTQLRKGNNEDIVCTDEFCHTTKWAESSVKGDNVLGLNQNPIRKDTINLPAGGYAVIRVKFDNPGRWLMHCHIDYDYAYGMAMVLNVDSERQLAYPSEMPTCYNFINKEATKKKRKTKRTDVEKGSCY